MEERRSQFVMRRRSPLSTLMFWYMKYVAGSSSSSVMVTRTDGSPRGTE